MMMPTMGGGNGPPLPLPQQHQQQQGPPQHWQGPPPPYHFQRQQQWQQHGPPAQQSPPPPPKPKSLGPIPNTRWSAAASANGKVYYFHRDTKEVSWKLPAEVAAASSAAADKGRVDAAAAGGEKAAGVAAFVAPPPLPLSSSLQPRPPPRRPPHQKPAPVALTATQAAIVARVAAVAGTALLRDDIKAAVGVKRERPPARPARFQEEEEDDDDDGNFDATFEEEDIRPEEPTSSSAPRPPPLSSSARPFSKAAEEGEDDRVLAFKSLLTEKGVSEFALFARLEKDASLSSDPRWRVVPGGTKARKAAFDEWCRDGGGKGMGDAAPAKGKTATTKGAAAAAATEKEKEREEKERRQRVAVERKRQEAEVAGRQAARDAERRSRDAALRAAEEDFRTLLAEVVVFAAAAETEEGENPEDFSWDAWRETLESDPLGRGKPKESGGKSILSERERQRLFERRVGDLEREKWEREERKRKEREEDEEEEYEGDLPSNAAPDAKRARLPAEEEQSESSDEDE